MSRQPHRRARQARGYLKRAFALADEMVADGVPHLQRMEAAGVPYEESEGFLELVADSKMVTNSLRDALEILQESGQEDPELIPAFNALTPKQLVAVAELSHQAANLAILEGFVLGVIYVAERRKTRATTRASRPTR